VSADGEADNAALARYDRDEAFRARVIAMLYQADRPRFISSVISLAVSEGYGRREAVEFANAVTGRIRHDALRKSARDAHAAGEITRDDLEDRLRRIAFMERQDHGD
jgi:hypothetical protein